MLSNEVLRMSQRVEDFPPLLKTCNGNDQSLGYRLERAVVLVTVNIDLHYRTKDVSVWYRGLSIERALRVSRCLPDTNSHLVFRALE